jgi:hypothetical protein
VTRPRTIEEFLEQLERSLRISRRHKRRVLDEARDHLIEARDRAIAGGLEPRAAETAAIKAFGDPAVVASRFDPGLVARLTGAVDRYDRWRAVHPTVGITFGMAPVVLAVTVFWSPLFALGLVPIWATYVWIGRQLKGRPEPGYLVLMIPVGWFFEAPKRYEPPPPSTA